MGQGVKHDKFSGFYILSFYDYYAEELKKMEVVFLDIFL